MSTIDYAIYTDLDALLDTRFVTYGMLAFEHLTELQVNGFNGLPYYHRLTEYTELVDQVEWEKLYKARTKEMLAAAMPTGVMHQIVDILLQVIDPNLRDALPEYGKILLNTYPYKLTEAEECQFIHDLLRFAPIPSFSEIETIHIDPMSINQSYLKKNRVKALFSYDGSEILSNLAEHYALANNPLPTVSLMVPAISRSEGMTLSKLFDSETYDFGPFGLMEITLGEYIDLKFLNGSVFSGILTKPIKPAKSPKEPNITRTGRRRR